MRIVPIEFSSLSDLNLYFFHEYFLWMSHSCKHARALSFACSPKVYQSVSKRWRIDFMFLFYQLILIKGKLFIEDFFGTEKGHSSIGNQSCSRSLCRVSDKPFPARIGRLLERGVSWWSILEMRWLRAGAELVLVRKCSARQGHARSLRGISR